VDPSDHDRNEWHSALQSGDHESTHAKGGQPGEDVLWLRSALRNASEIVKVVDPDGTLRYASPAFEKVLGYDPAEAVGRMNVLDHVHPDDLPRVLTETERALAEESVVSNVAEYRFRHADGSWRWVESVGTYLLDDPQVRGIVVNVRDVTRRKEAEEAAREGERRLASVISNAHAYAYRCLNEPGWPNEYASDYALELTGYPPEDLLVGERSGSATSSSRRTARRSGTRFRRPSPGAGASS
jgi:PAS domain S-box-containing protein